MGRGRPQPGPACRIALFALAALLPAVAFGQNAEAPEPPAGVAAIKPGGELGGIPDLGEDQISKLERDFVNYLHFAQIGRFEIAEEIGKSLLANPDLSPKLTDQGKDELLRLTDEYTNSIEHLVLLVGNSSIGESAGKLLDLIAEANRRKRMDPALIKQNIGWLNGTPTQRQLGLERLTESGEYAIPWMLEAYADPDRAALRPFIARALPRLGRPVINPLVVALESTDPDVVTAVAEALGRLGYPQALPYLRRLATDAKASKPERAAAEQAVAAVVVGNPEARQLPADVLFNQLAEQYYADFDTLRPDPREDRVNVWFLREGIVTPVEVPRTIYNEVMCMRACKASLALSADQPVAVALWLAANFRREAELGLDVESEAAAETLDLTRPADFPRSIYFARSAGPSYCQLVLGRAVRDLDPNVALGAIAAMKSTAGPASLVESSDNRGAGLASPLRFPHALVRIRAALALGQALPDQSFRGADEVVPVLASALALTGGNNYLVIDPQATTREKLARALAAGGHRVVATSGLREALEQATRQFTHLDGAFITSDVANPQPLEAIRALRDDARFGLTPLVVLVKPGDNLLLDKLVTVSPPVGNSFFVSEDQADTITPDMVKQLLARRDQVAGKAGYRGIPAELSLALAIEAAYTLRHIAEHESAVFDARVGEQALVEALRHDSPDLRLAAARALAVIPTPSGQAAVATLALEPQEIEDLRIQVFASLAESARKFGALLDPELTDRLVGLAINEPNLRLRTAASQALGAMNLPGHRAAEIILAQPVK